MTLYGLYVMALQTKVKTGKMQNYFYRLVCFGIFGGLVVIGLNGDGNGVTLNESMNQTFDDYYNGDIKNVIPFMRSWFCLHVTTQYHQTMQTFYNIFGKTKEQNQR